jgi:simple sugar transport system ATP-binding protein
MSLELRDVRKAFGPVRANDGVSLTVEAGTLHGLLGENGAGKSTLMKILSGFIGADGGEIVLDGRRLELASPRDGIDAGIGMLHQDPLVFLPFSVLDNFLLGGPGGVRVDRRAGARALREMCERFGFAFDLDAPARSLTVGERQQLEIVRLLWLGARVLVLDEPTTGISASQRIQLFEVLRALAFEMKMIVIFVSHKLEEVEELCGRVTVMRRGRAVGEAELPCPTERLVELMFGRVLVEPEPAQRPPGEPVLELDGARLRGPTGTTEDLDLVVREGEVIGLAGLEGSGQRTLLRACAGLLEPAAGRVRVSGRDLTGRGYGAFLDAAVHFLPAGRLEEGLVAGLTIAEHFVLTGGQHRFFVDWDRARRSAGDRIRDHHIVGGPDSAADALSGGNQQRLLLAMMPPDVRLLLMEHPTRGLDIESAGWVWSRLLERRQAGTAIVFASADLDELLRYSDRILVFFSGRVLKVVDARTTTGEELGHLIGGKELV